MVFVFRMDWPDRIFGRFSPPRGIQSFRISFPRSFNTTGAHRLVTNVTHWSWALELAKYNHKMSTRNGKLCEGDCHTVFNSPDKEQTYAIFAYSCWFSSDKRIYIYIIKATSGNPCSCSVQSRSICARQQAFGALVLNLSKYLSSEAVKSNVDRLMLRLRQVQQSVTPEKPEKIVRPRTIRTFCGVLFGGVFFPSCIFLAVPGVMAVYMYIIYL